MSYFAALKHRQFRLLWASQTISRVGDHLYEVALAWWVLKQTGSAAVMATVLLCSIVPLIVFALLGGSIVDRLPRARLMLGSDLARGAILLGITVLAGSQSLEVWHLYLASILFGFVDAFFQPAYTALVPEITAQQDLSSANAITSLSTQIGRVAGPVLAAAVIAAGDTTAAFACDAISFFCSAALLLPLLGLPKSPISQVASSAQPGLLADMRAGLGLLARTPWLWMTIGLIAITNVTLGGPFQVALPFLFAQGSSAGIYGLGLLYAAFPIGYIASGIWLGRQPTLRRRGPIIYAGIALAGLGMAALGLPIGLAGMLAAAVLNGASLEAHNLAWVHALQELIPNESLGRIAGLELASTYGLIPVGLLLAGWATTQLGAANVCLIGGALTMVFAALGLAHPAIRRVD